MEYVNSAVLSLTTQADFGELDPPLNLTFKHVNQVRIHYLSNQLQKQFMFIICKQ